MENNSEEKGVEEEQKGVEEEEQKGVEEEEKEGVELPDEYILEPFITSGDDGLPVLRPIPAYVFTGPDVAHTYLRRNTECIRNDMSDDYIRYLVETLRLCPPITGYIKVPSMVRAMCNIDKEYLLHMEVQEFTNALEACLFEDRAKAFSALAAVNPIQYENSISL